MVDPLSPRFHVFPDPRAAVSGLAEQVAELARASLSRTGQFALALSGGSTPEALFRVFASELRAAVPWDRVDYFWADERAVPPDDPRSNYGLAARTWLTPLSIPDVRVHRIRTEIGSPEEAAKAYETDLRRYADRRASEGSNEWLDLALLGVGKDGHTASLFPGRPLLMERESWVGVEGSPTQDPPVPRISLTLGALNRARRAAFLAVGEEKQVAIANVRQASMANPAPPAAQVRALDGVDWYVDRAALGSPPHGGWSEGDHR